MKKYHSVMALMGMALVLNACGASSSSEPQNEEKELPQDGSTVETIYDLGKCSSDREGDVVFVEEDEAYYKCKKKGWKITEEPASSSSKGKSSSSKDDSDSSKDDFNCFSASVLFLFFSFK